MAVRNLVALKFNAGLHVTGSEANGHKAGHAKYPDFNQVSIETRKGMDWCNYVDSFGIGMQYDKNCGHQDSGDTPAGEQACVIAVPQDFATEALELFPITVTQLTSVEFEAFYNDKAHVNEAADYVDTDVLNAIKAKEDLSIAVPEKADAVNRDSASRGIRKNHNKYWADFKVKAGVNVI